MMKKTYLTQERLKSLLQYNQDTGEFTWLVSAGRVMAGKKAGCLIRDGYINIRVDSIIYRAHRLAWFYITGSWPQNDIDHINGVRNDNRLCNLRPATRSQNLANMRLTAKNTSGFKGASFFPRLGCWKSRIRHKGKQITIGYFATPEEAHAAYCAEATKLNGEFFNPGRSEAA